MVWRRMQELAAIRDLTGALFFETAVRHGAASTSTSDLLNHVRSVANVVGAKPSAGILGRALRIEGPLKPASDRKTSGLQIRL